MIKVQKIDFPLDCKIIRNEFYTYDPSTSFNKADSAKYLNEDLLQAFFSKDNVIIDLGWYGDIATNKGEYRIYVIKNENWEVPFSVIHSKSTGEVKDLLIKVLNYYSGGEGED
jgi:hypothetical protein